MIWLSAFIIGFLGSFHCIGMCGPIAMAIPGGKNKSRSVNLLLYNSGRVITYSAIGFIFGIVGKGIFVAGLQQKLSILIGLLILCYLVLTIVSKKNKLEKITKFHLFLKKKLSILFKTNTRGSVLSIGLLNGLLPCGLVYVAIAGAIAMAGPLNGSLYMALFGLGTIPVMAGITLVKGYISLDFRAKIRRLIPVAIAAMAILFIIRGLDLGIPYLSPKIEAEQVQVICH